MPFYPPGDRILAKLCTYCGSEIGLARSLLGEVFCSSEHSELYFREQSQMAFARVLGSSSRPRQSTDPPTAAPPASLTLAAPEAKCLSQDHLDPSTPPLPDPAPLGQLEQADLAPSSKLEPLPLTAEVNGFEAESEAVAHARQQPSDSFLHNATTAAPVQAELISSTVADDTAPERVPASMSDSAEPPANEPRWSIRRWTILAIAAGITIAVLGATLFNPSSSNNQPTFTRMAAAGRVQLKAAPANVPPLASTGSKSHASIQATGRSWVVACADSKVLFAKLFTAGSKDNVDFTSTAIVRIGSAGAIQIEVNGKPVGTLGALGQVRVVELNPGGSHFRAGGETDDCTKGF